MPPAGATLTVDQAERRTMLRRALVARTVGTAIDAYDFLLYSTAAGLVFGKVFFPETDPTTGLLLAFGTYAVGFLSRPIGAALFGHYGDRIGANDADRHARAHGAGHVPDRGAARLRHARHLGGIVLSLLRFVQGLGVGGEWGGAVLLAMEWGQQERRGFIASWPHLGVPAGLLLANLAVLLFSAVSGDGFLVWGWRIPFLLSFVLLFVGLYLRLGVIETPAFQQLVQRRRIEPRPMLAVVRRYPKEILLSALVRVSEQAPFYVYTGFIFAYGTTVLGFDRNFLLVPVLVASLLSAVIIPTAGHLSDRVGRRPVYLVGVVGTGIWGFVYFGLLDTRIVVLAFLALALSLVFHDVQWGPQAALIAESFPTRLRYSGSAIGWNLASVIAGGPAPLIATALLAASRSSFTVAVYILVCAVISGIALGLMPERSRQDISVEHEEALEAAGLSPRPGAAR